MIEVKIPKEIRSYQSGFLFGLTLRQTLAMAAAATVNIPLYLLLYPKIGSDLAGWVIIGTATPFILIGFIKFNGMVAEQAFLCMWRFLTNNQKCLYETENMFRSIMEEANEEGKEERNGRKARRTKA